MSREIREFKLSPPFILEMNREAKILEVDVINNCVLLFAEIDNALPTVKRTFTVVGLRQPIPDYAETYVGTVSPEAGYLLHIYEDNANAFDQTAVSVIQC